jgi:hypothetical protein
MKKLFNWQVLLGLGLVALSALVYFLHYLIFRDPHHIFIYLVGDVAFVPVEVLLVTLIIHRLLAVREKRALLKKLNMVIGAFFSETGDALIGRLTEFDPDIERLRKEPAITGGFGKDEISGLWRFLETYGHRIDARRGDLAGLKGFLLRQRQFLLGLLQNPNLLEHDSFTELLWAVFHLAEELGHREGLSSIPEKDREHLEGDMARAYARLVSEWLRYMNHLRKEYPYLFSLAVRTNPFNPAARAEIT